MAVEVYDIYIGDYRFRSNTLNPLVMPRWTANVSNGRTDSIVETWTLDCIYYANTQAELWSDFNAFKAIIIDNPTLVDIKVQLNGTNVLTMLVGECGVGPYFRELVIKDEPGTYANQIQFTLVAECVKIPGTAIADVFWKRRSHRIVLAEDVEEHEWTIEARGIGAKSYVMNPANAFAGVVSSHTGEFSKAGHAYESKKIKRKALHEQFDEDTWTATYSSVEPLVNVLQLNETIIVDYPLKPLRFLPMFRDGAEPQLSVGRLREATITYNLAAFYAKEEDALAILTKAAAELKDKFDPDIGGTTDYKAPLRPKEGPIGSNEKPESYKVTISAEFKFTSYDETKIKALVPALYDGLV